MLKLVMYLKKKTRNIRGLCFQFFPRTLAAYASNFLLFVHEVNKTFSYYILVVLYLLSLSCFYFCLYILFLFYFVLFLFYIVMFLVFFSNLYLFLFFIFIFIIVFFIFFIYLFSHFFILIFMY